MVGVVMPYLSRAPAQRSHGGSQGYCSVRRHWNVMVKEMGMHIDHQFLGQRHLGSMFPPGTEAEKEGARERLKSSSRPSFLPSSPSRRLVGEEAGKGLPQVADGLSLGLVFTWGPSMGGI